MLALALVLLRLYIKRSRIVAEPIIRPALFADPAFTVPNVINVLANLAGFSILLLTPYYLVNILKLSALISGLVLALAFAGALAGAPLAARLEPLLGRRPTAFAGVVLVGLGLLPLAFTDAATPLPWVAFLLIIEGVGQGLLSVAYTDLVMATLAERDRGVAGSLALLTRTVGIVSGASVLSALHAHGAADGFLAGYRYAFLAAGGGLSGTRALLHLVARLVCPLIQRCTFPRLIMSANMALFVDLGAHGGRAEMGRLGASLVELVKRRGFDRLVDVLAILSTIGVGVPAGRECRVPARRLPCRSRSP